MRLFRRILAVNAISHIDLVYATQETFLPQVLVHLGLFPSNNQVRKNRPGFWRQVQSGETIKVGRLNITITMEEMP